MPYEKCKWCGRKVKKSGNPYCDGCSWYFEANPDKIIVDGELVDG